MILYIRICFIRWNFEIFGNTLKLLRKKHGYSQDDVSDKIKVKRSTYANYERETREPIFHYLLN